MHLCGQPSRPFGEVAVTTLFNTSIETAEITIKFHLNYVIDTDFIGSSRDVVLL
ncbi:hypothetical protein Pla100_15690 [Neorhodopirellula pilleata]|uniref:Uncharacterized protein n=1 Tax=Neorhodopirellula pilleata TaxID=2714738 RepID=A0A5C6APA3_9BACT|nr:hypothetical protein Pla100_15690 [Neorhodopirellula pilleata]